MSPLPGSDRVGSGALDQGHGGPIQPPESFAAGTHRRLERRVIHLRTTRRLGPMQISGRVGLPASTVHAVLVRHGLNRLATLDRATGEPIRRYEKARPGEQVHVDIKKLGVIPAGGGWRVHGRGRAPNRWRGERVNADSFAARGRGQVGYGFIHAAVDDHSRLAYCEIHDDETGPTAVGFWLRANEFFAEHGITVTEILTDNGWAHLAFMRFCSVRRSRSGATP